MFYNLNLSHKFYIISKLPMDSLIYYLRNLLIFAYDWTYYRKGV
jgi:hypothetical protein